MNDKILPGGYFYDNIREWLIDECFMSTNAEEYFDNILLVINDLADDRSWLQDEGPEDEEPDGWQEDNDEQ